MTGCALPSPERIVRLDDTERGQPVAKKTLIFTHSRESWIPGADVPLFGPDVDIVEVPLDANGEAHIHPRRVLWWVGLDENNNRSGRSGTSITSSDLRDGGTFRLYRPPPIIGDTNIFPSKYSLTIKKP